MKIYFIITKTLFLMVLLCSCSKENLYEIANSSNNVITKLSDNSLLTSFTFKTENNPALLTDVNATVSDDGIYAVFDYDTDISSLVATFETSGKNVLVNGELQKSGITSNDFTQELTYTVEAENGDSTQYAVKLDFSLAALQFEVDLSGISTDDSTINLTWVEPVIETFYKIEITNLVTDEIYLVDSGIQSYSIINLNNGTYYSFVIRIVDTLNNRSTGKKAGATPVAGGPINYTLIHNANELSLIGIDVNYPVSNHYSLVNDISLSAYSSWTPILPFTGTFDGNGFIISDLTINTTTTPDIGLFSTITGTSIIRNIILKDVKIQSTTMNTGALVGRVDTNCEIINCSVQGTLDFGGGQGGGIAGNNQGSIKKSHANISITSGASNNSIGGLVGFNRAGGIIEQCSVTGSIDSVHNMTGGMVGQNTGHIFDSHSSADIIGTQSALGGFVGSNTGKIQNSYASGNVTGGANNTGGFAGYNTSLITHCHAFGDVISTTKQCGGFIGYLNGGTIEHCSAKGNVSTTDTLTAGFVGLITGSSSVIRYSFATGAVSSSEGGGGFTGQQAGGTISDCYSINSSITSTTTSFPVGGFIRDASSGSYTNCYSVAYSLNTSSGYQGGFIGDTNSVIFTNCYFDFDVAPYGSYVYSTGTTPVITPSTTAFMKSSALVTALGATIWTIAPAGIINDGYPYLINNQP